MHLRRHRHAPALTAAQRVVLAVLLLALVALGSGCATAGQPITLPAPPLVRY